jgi:thiamine-monophosphate kinase
LNGEFGAISAIESLLPAPGPEVECWIGDDAAVVALGGGRRLLLAADAVVAGVHADLSLTGLDDLGWKAMAACLSDVAAMGGEAGHALVTVAGPPDTDLVGLYRGVADASRAFRCPVVGGDLVNSGALVVSVAVTGWCDGPPVSRGGARPGDLLWVTGPLGASAAGLRLLREEARGLQRPGSGGQIGLEAPENVGLEAPENAAANPIADALRRHARPTPMIAAGRAARSAGATAMIDVSDGLAADLSHLASRSGVGILLDEVPVHPAATLAEALGGGEDFVLIFAAPPEAPVDDAFSSIRTPIRIGRCTADPAERTFAGQPLAKSGWEHHWPSSSG